MRNAVTKLALSAALAGFSLNAAADAVIGSQLKQDLLSLNPTDSVMAVVTFDQMDKVSSNQMQQLLNLGLTEGVQFQSLPIVGVKATPAQIDAISKLEGVRSVFANRNLEYFNAESRVITGVDRVQSNEFRAANGTTFTGKGVTVMVNDSGIDATLDDLKFGSKVVQNVQAVTHAQALTLTPVRGTWIEDQLTTDLNVGHGTHCAGTLAGTGAHSNGKHKGAAPDADLVGYGSGAGLSILDAVGGYDYALTHLYDFNSPIRIMSNSWGSSGKFDPAGPIAVSSFVAYKNGLLSVFAAGNSGPGEDTHNPYAQIPWGMSVGAGTKSGTLIDFSSRGKKGEEGTFTMPDGSEWTYKNEVSIVAPGVDIISTRAKTNAVSNGGADDVDAIEAEYLPYYTMISGTSMATPHVAGIAAVMLEANPNLSPLDIKKLMMETATNIPGYETWEVGAGYVNAEAAVAAALNYDGNYDVTVNNLNEFNANAILIPADEPIPFSVNYIPVGNPDEFEFYVGKEVAFVSAAADNLANTTKLKLTAPDGTEYYGNLTLPVLETGMRVSAPGQQGIWSIEGYGLTSLSGVEPDPLGITNGPGLPDVISGEITLIESGGYEGLSDINGHPAKGAIEFAVSERLVDGFEDGSFQPDADLTKGDLSKYLVMGAAVRQYRDLLNQPSISFDDVTGSDAAFAEAVSAPAGALKDAQRTQDPVVRTTGSSFDADTSVNRAELAYSLVQALGLQAEAEQYTGDITVQYNGEAVSVVDQDSIPAELRGHVQAALNLSLLSVEFDVEQGPYDLEPTLVARFKPSETMTRGEYAVIISRTYDSYYK
ncbi:S8 family serine peptidase [Kangiella spongicola]|uniref:Peptidase S8 n=1 Tax=Kangiella spongicola TaxID=796379 RepID=A0A318D0I8_9GAMM|nr:S8 family serine peptidase [Kangiella spongicola]PXF62742.1 peptidase S8 [Kangiella spongicola]